MDIVNVLLLLCNTLYLLDLTLIPYLSQFLGK